MTVARQHLTSHLGRPGAGKVYRGSRKRLRRLKWREHTPAEFWILVVIVIVMLLVVIPWLINHPPAEHHHETDATLGSRS
jgi:type II secretory pathway component PulM